MGDIPKSLKKAYYHTIEQELYGYKYIKEYVDKTVNEYMENEEHEPSIQATAPQDFYITGASNNPNIIKAHNTVRNIRNLTLDQVTKMLNMKRKFNEVAATISTVHFIEMYRVVTAIDDTLERLQNSNIGDERKKYELIKARYFEKRFTPEGLAFEFNISRATVYNWCYSVIYEIAKRLGMEE